MEKIKSLLPLNFALLSNPVNWVIVFLMVTLATIGLALILKTATPNPSAIVKE